VSNLCPSLITFLLLPKMKITAEKFGSVPRLVVVSSDSHAHASITKDMLNAESIHKQISTEPG
jgi:hypothetical protein